MCSTPNPRISGKNIPIILVIQAAISKSLKGDQFVFFAIDANFLKKTI